MATTAKKKDSGDELAAKIDKLTTVMDTAAKTVQRPRITVASKDLPVHSYWEDTDETVEIDRGRAGELYKSLGSLEKAGYKRATSWKSLGQFLQQGFRDPLAFKDLHIKHMSAHKAIQGMSELVGSDGGFTVLPEYSPRIFEKVYENDLLSRSEGFTVGGNGMIFNRNAETSRANGSRHGGLRGYWVNEGGTITSSKPTLGQLTLRLKKLAVIVYLTDELLDDTGMALEQYVTRKVSEEFNFMIGDAIVNGSGGGQPRGILNSGALLSVAKEVGQGASTIVAENIDKMWERRYTGSDDYVWLTHQDTHSQLQQLSQAVGTGGSLLYRPPGGLAEGPFATLKGAPLIETEFNATVGTQGDVILADLGQWVNITKGGIAQAASIHVEFLTDQTALRFIMRIDGDTWENSPVTPYKGSNTPSSFLTLDTRA